MEQATELKSYNTTPDKHPRFRISQFEVGDVWVISDPILIVKVVEKATHPVKQPGGIVQDSPAILAKATVPAVEIEGYVTRRQAVGGRELNRRIKEDHDELGATDDRVWSEVWAEIPTYGVVGHPKVRGCYVVNDAPGAPMYPTLICVEEHGRETTRSKSSPCKGPVVGWKVPANLVPEGLFPDEIVVKEGPEPESVAVSASSTGNTRKGATRKGARK